MSWLGSLFEGIRGIVSPVTELIDQVHTSTEEKLDRKVLLAQLQQARDEIQARTLTTLSEHETRQIESQHKLQALEQESKSALTRLWRPLLGLGLGFGILLNLVLPLFISIWRPGYAPPSLDPYLIGIVASLLGVGVVARTMDKRGEARVTGTGPA